MRFPFQTIHFDAGGNLKGSTAADLQTWITSQGITDLFIFSHGWNNDEATAGKLYEGFFGAMSAVLSEPGVRLLRPGAIIGVLGILWPSILWPGDSVASIQAGGAASLSLAPPRQDLFDELKKVFVIPRQQSILDELNVLLAARQPNDHSLAQFKQELSALLASTGDAALHDSLEKRGIAGDDTAYREIFSALADQELPSDSEGGAAGLGVFDSLWRGAKAALRVATFYQMKDRAGVVGEKGLGPLLKAGGPRFYLLGHSFGARVISYALRSADPGAVKMLYLLQGAFSHFAFAKTLPFDGDRCGDLAGADAKVDGPLITTHSLYDLAVGAAYPLAAFVARDDVAMAGDADYRWSAMGHDGAQSVNAVSLPLDGERGSFPFHAGQWLNLDGNRIIRTGGPPSGAHGDIVHPETAWVALAGAGLV